MECSREKSIISGVVRLRLVWPQKEMSLPISAAAVSPSNTICLISGKRSVGLTAVEDDGESLVNEFEGLPDRRRRGFKGKIGGLVFVLAIIAIRAGVVARVGELDD